MGSRLALVESSKVEFVQYEEGAAVRSRREKKGISRRWLTSYLMSWIDEDVMITKGMSGRG